MKKARRPLLQPIRKKHNFMSVFLFSNLKCFFLSWLLSNSRAAKRIAKGELEKGQERPYSTLALGQTISTITDPSIRLIRCGSRNIKRFSSQCNKVLLRQAPARGDLVPIARRPLPSRLIATQKRNSLFWKGWSHLSVSYDWIFAYPSLYYSGALVLSDGGVCCFDEFHKTSDATRSVFHEVMVSIITSPRFCISHPSKLVILGTTNSFHCQSRHHNHSQCANFHSRSCQSCQVRTRSQSAHHKKHRSASNPNFIFYISFLIK